MKTLRRSRFLALTRHFVARFFDNDAVSRQGEMQTSVVQLLGLLAVPGFFLCFYMMKHYPPTARHPFDSWQATSDRYLFVSYSMMVMGFVTVFEWDSLFPDRRDYLILSALPIRVFSLFCSKVLALCFFLGLFAFDLNCFSTVLLPVVSMGHAGSSSNLHQMMLAHATSAVAGGLFVAFFFAGLQGILINVLTSKAFRWVSPLVQMVSMGLLVLVLILYPLISALIQTLVEQNSPYLFYFPCFWFLGLYESLRPGVVHPVFHPLAMVAVRSLALASAVCLVAYVAGYRRHARRALESIELQLAGPGRLRVKLTGLLHNSLLRHPLQRATFHFIGQTLARSSRHRLFLAAYGGFAMAFAILIVFAVANVGGVPKIQVSPIGVLAVPLILSFCLLTGLRAAFSFPAELTPNWAFQVTDASFSDEHLKACRRWVALSGILPLFVLLAPLEFAMWRWNLALFHLSFGVILSWLLVEVLFFHFHKIPFACSYCPGKMNAAVLAALYLYGLTTYSFSMTDLEVWILHRPVRVALFFLLSAALLLAFRTHRIWRPDAVGLTFEDEPDPVVRTLGIG
ncbi:MAG: hypothetical protein ABJF23_03510 [Bryobacteraceae bacterium]